MPATNLFLVEALIILGRCHSMRDLEVNAIGHRSVRTEVLGIEFRRPQFDSYFQYFYRQVLLTAHYATYRNWSIAQIPDGIA